MSIQECLFCANSRFSVNMELSLPADESIIWEDKNVYVTPDLFPLSVGHYLIISKLHYCSYGNSSIDVYKSCFDAIRYIRYKILKNWDTVIFEHGDTANHTGGSSINHAHIHLMPLEFDISSIIEDSVYICGKSKKISYQALRYFYQKNQPYILYQRNDEVGNIYPVNQLPSQYLRKIIAQRLSIPYDWKKIRINNSFCSRSNERFLNTLVQAKGLSVL